MTTEKFVSLDRLLVEGRPLQYPVALDGHRVFTWNDFATRVAALGGTLQACSEKRWALCCVDAFQFATGLFALMHSGKHVVIPHSNLMATLDSLAGAFEALLVDDDVRYPTGWTTLSAASCGATPLTHFQALRPEGLRVDMFTSGTAGAPKRVDKLASQLTAEVDDLQGRWGAEAASTRIAATVAHHHIYGLLFRILWPLAAGLPFDVDVPALPNDLLRRVRQLSPVTLISSPAHLARLPDLMGLEQLTPHVRRVFSSGGPLSPAAALCWRRALGRAPTEVYGSTETGGIACREQSEDDERWSPFPEVDVRVDAQGALFVRSPYVGGASWFAVGDRACADASGRFRLTGRVDRVVKLEEKRLCLSEMESRLGTHPWVAEAGLAVVEGRRRLVGAVIVLSEEGRRHLEQRGRRDLVANLEGHLAAFYEKVLLPRRWRFTRSMPLNERGKPGAEVLLRVLNS